MEFVEGAPPAEVFDEGRFDFSVNIKAENKGEWDIQNPSDLTITLTGVDPADFNNPTLTNVWVIIKEIAPTIANGE